MNIIIENNNNNILLKKRKKKFRDCPKDTLFQTGFEAATFEFPTYITNYLTRPITISAIRLFVYSDVFECIYSEA